MFNVGGGEVLVILLVALLVIGPGKLPDAARHIGNALTQLKQMSSGFQNELKSAMDATVDPDPSTPPPTGPADAGDEPADTPGTEETVQSVAADADAATAEGDDDPAAG